MTRIMYDSVTISDLPRTARMVLGYADGHYQESVAAIKRQCPKATVPLITVKGLPDANICDCENGDLTPAEAARWAQGRVRSKAIPTIYANASTMPAVKAELLKLHLRPGVDVLLFVAEYDGKGVIPPGYIAKQFLGSPGNSPGHYDESVCADYWPGVDPKPKALKPRTLPVHVRAAYWLLTRWLERYVKRAKKGPVHPLATVTRDHLHRLATDITAADKADAK